MFESEKNGQYWRELGIMQSSTAVQVMLSEIPIKRHIHDVNILILIVITVIDLIY